MGLYIPFSLELHVDCICIHIFILTFFFFLPVASCLEFTLPTTIDLVILEQLVFAEEGDIALDIERLVHRIWLHGRNSSSSGPLPVIILNMDRVWVKCRSGMGRVT